MFAAGRTQASLLHLAIVVFHPFRSLGRSLSSLPISEGMLISSHLFPKESDQIQKGDKRGRVRMTTRIAGVCDSLSQIRSAADCDVFPAACDRLSGYGDSCSLTESRCGRFSASAKSYSDSESEHFGA